MPRREHKKSRKGCLTCKARRVKVWTCGALASRRPLGKSDCLQCSEDGPPCQNCFKKAIECRYNSEVHETPQAHGIEVPSVRECSYLQTQARSDSRAQRQLFELELVHHYTSSTWRTFCHNHRQDGSRQQDEETFLQITYPRNALQNTFTSQALFAVTALHMASLMLPAARGRYVRAALQYQSWAQLGFAAAIIKPSDQCDSILLFTTSLVFFVLAMAAPRYTETDQELDSPMDNILMAYRLFRGSDDILQKVRQNHPSHPLIAILSPKDMSVFHDCDPGTRHAMSRLRSIVTQKYISRSAPTPDQAQPDLLDELDWGFQRLQAGNMSVALGWLSVAPEHFVKDLTEGEVQASIIFLHWCVLLHRTSSLWWVPKSGAAIAVQLLSDLRSRLISMDTLVGQSLSWCQEQISSTALNQSQH